MTRTVNDLFVNQYRTGSDDGPTRRHFLARTLRWPRGVASRSACLPSAVPIPAAWPCRRRWPRVRSAAILDALPGKKPLIKLSYRPPNYETPLEYFRRS
jgi:hypothetical protein